MNGIFLQTLRGSFSAVSTPIFASKYSLESSWRDLQDLHTFAPLRSQNFSQKSSTFFFTPPKGLTFFCWIFEIWAVQKYENLVNLEKSFKHAAKWVFGCYRSCRYSRERASQSLRVISFHFSFVSLRTSHLIARPRRAFQRLGSKTGVHGSEHSSLAVMNDMFAAT